MGSDPEIVRVLRAVSQGYRTREAIAEAAALDVTKTQTYLTRLMHRNLVESSKSPDATERRLRVKHYHLAGIKPFLLQHAWGKSA
jgi:DNA-binding MarR family transcriptional regulator